MNPFAKIAYLDCFSGISGDMFLGALLHAGLDLELLEKELARLEGVDFLLTVSNELRCGIGCKQVTITSPSDQQFRHLDDILTLLDRSRLAPEIIHRARQVFTLLAEAEAKIHNVALQKIHFHEVGAVDTIVDIVGTLIGLHHLGISKLVCSPLPMGRGFVRCAHGTLPLPAPAVCELVTGIPVYGVEQELELVTPTGAALVAGLADDFGPMPFMTVQSCGYGAGNHHLSKEQPNLLRLLIGQPKAGKECQQVEIIETHLDDWNSEGFPYLCNLLFSQGALDVSLSPLIMKKGRPGQLLRVIAAPAHTLELKQTILSETTAIGLRFRREERMTLEREAVMILTPWGEIAAKKVQTPRGPVISPEYEACRKVAATNNVPLSRVYQAVSCGEENKEQ
ncbi:MAG: nickel pincer cofactor biosynthesis protein LarC [Proteobacteria bacterium]|nr:nickel pincer cofactor biosynthesis protein LarC [Pseudomonadota bacterium]MBU1058094.1 nickel pincer cofactor biosynthesis protein LarC [Pseudomonadota bacterium]